MVSRGLLELDSRHTGKGTAPVDEDPAARLGKGTCPEDVACIEHSPLSKLPLDAMPSFDIQCKLSTDPAMM